MALDKGADMHQSDLIMIHCRPNRFFFYRAETVFVRVDIAPINTAAREVKTVLGAIELDRYFGAETAELLKLQCNR